MYPWENLLWYNGENVRVYIIFPCVFFFPTQGHLSDNKWHTVIIGRPTRYSHTLMVDGHIATATTRGDNYHLDLDGILYLGNLSLSTSPFIYQKITKNGPYFLFCPHSVLFSPNYLFNLARLCQQDELLRSSFGEPKKCIMRVLACKVSFWVSQQPNCLKNADVAENCTKEVERGARSEKLGEKVNLSRTKLPVFSGSSRRRIALNLDR